MKIRMRSSSLELICIWAPDLLHAVDGEDGNADDVSVIDPVEIHSMSRRYMATEE